MTKQLKTIGRRAASISLAFMLASSGPVFAQATPDTVTDAPDISETVTQTETDALSLSSDWKFDNPKIPYEYIIGGGMGLAALFAFYGIGRRRITPRYAVAGTAVSAALLLALVNGETENVVSETFPTEVIVATDLSESVLSVEGRAEITKQVREALIGKLENARNISVRVVDIGDTNTAGDDSTKLFTTLRDLSDINPEHVGALFILTDGQIHDVPDISPYGSDIPVHVLLSGQNGETDRVTSLVHTPKFGFVDETESVRFKVEDFGVVNTGGQIKVTITSADGTEETLDVTASETIETEIDIIHAGPNIYTIEAEPLDGELTGQNNKIIITVQGRREDLNVLLISGTPGKGNMSLREFLLSDPESNVVQFLISRTPQDYDDTPRKELGLSPFPHHEVDREALGKYDLIIIDSYLNYYTITEENLAGIRDYVSDGGALLVRAGPEFTRSRSIYRTPIGKILPIQPQRRTVREAYLPQITDDGYKHPVTRGLGGVTPETDPEWGPWTFQIKGTLRDGADATVVMDGADGHPLLVLDRLEAEEEGAEDGRVAVLLSDSAWLWDKGFMGGGPHDELLRRTVHWLMKSPELEEEALRMTSTNRGVITIERQTMADEAPPPVTLTMPSGETEEITLEEAEPGLWRATLETEEKGVYEVTQTDGEETYTAVTKVGFDMSVEMHKVISTADILQPVVDMTGGSIERMTNESGAITLPEIRLLTAEEAKEGIVGDNWVGIRLTEAQDIKEISRTPLIPPIVLFLFVLGGLIVANGKREHWNTVKETVGNVLKPKT